MYRRTERDITIIIIRTNVILGKDAGRVWCGCSDRSLQVIGRDNGRPLGIERW
jgi:hypothetical protein